MSTNTKRNSRKKSTNPLDNHIEQYVSELRTSGRSLGPEAFSEAVRTFSQRFVEAMLQGEMDAYLTGCQPKRLLKKLMLTSFSRSPTSATALVTRPSRPSMVLCH